VTTSGETLDDRSRWAEVERLFGDAIAQPVEERGAWLSAHAPDSGVRAEVAAMLAAHERVTGILDRRLALFGRDVQPRLERSLAHRYTILRLLGRGGSATVFLAREQKHDRTVVLKVLHPEIAAHVGVQRFLGEVRIAAQLSHPNILPLLDSGEVDGLLYYVMPYLEGETLRDRLTRQDRIRAGEAVALLRDIADALRAAHAAGIVHRDLKPENVLCAGDHAYLLDFGIARDFAVATRQTQEGMVVGTVGYMSPEQAEGRALGPPSDIFAWGVIAWEMLTGDSPLGMVSRGMRGVPEPLAQLILHALETDPDRRPASATELLTRLSALDSMRTRRLWWAVAGVAATAVALAVVAWNASRSDAAGRGLSLPVAVAPLQNETGDTTLAIWGRMAADWLTQGLHETSLVRVVPWSTVRHAWDNLEEPITAATTEAIARETGAGTVVMGSYYRSGDRIAFRLDVTDAARRELIASLPPVVVSRDSLDVGVREIRDRLMGFVALRYDERAAALPGLVAHPPLFNAYRAFDRGLELYNRQEYGAAAAEFRQAWSADTTFPVPLIYAAMAHWNRDDYEWVDTLVSTAQRHRDRLSEYDQLQLDYLAARLASDGPRAVTAAKRAVELAPESRAAYNLARDLIAMDRAAEGRELLERINPDRALMKGWPSYWTQLAHARHLTGDHHRELDAARAMRQRFPDSRVALVLEGRALAALGRFAELDSLVRQTAALPAATYWSHAATLVVAGEELTVHLDSARGLPYLRDAVAWLRRELRADPARREHRYWLGSALYDLAQWRAADSVFAGLSRDFPERIDYRGLAALTRARVGDPRGAARILGDPPRYARGEHTTYRARLAAISGDTAATRALRARMLDEVGSGFAWLHASAFRDFGLTATPR
jgi:tRNA A-37 threonylcarbamoyl transferase component Bud32/tetratricopeptide (TPR) repeat protein